MVSGKEILVICDIFFSKIISFLQIDSRLREAKPEKGSQPFGGISIILMGDFGQLPPVGEKAVYDDVLTKAFEAKGKLVYQLFNKCVTFESSMRQKDPDQAQFRDLLHKLSEGQFKHDDYKLLQTRARDNLSEEECNSFLDSGVRLCSRNKDLKKFNIAKLKELPSPKAILRAINNPKQAKLASTSTAGGLMNVTLLAEGCKVLLKKNLYKSAGLVNGARGTIHKIVFKPPNSPLKDPGLPDIIYINIPQYCGPPLFPDDPKVVPIVPVVSNWISDKKNFTRRQYPLVPAYAMSIHMSQGATLDKVSLNIGPKEFAVGLTYTGLSRAKRLDQIMLDPMPDLKRMTGFQRWKQFKQRLEEEKRLKEIEEKTLIEHDLQSLLTDEYMMD